MVEMVYNLPQRLPIFSTLLQMSSVSCTECWEPVREVEKLLEYCLGMRNFSFCLSIARHESSNLQITVEVGYVGKDDADFQSLV